MNIHSKTDKGLVRNDNQDYCLSGRMCDGAVWAVVCDGMGGANGGHTASTTACEYIARGNEKIYIPVISQTKNYMHYLQT